MGLLPETSPPLPPPCIFLPVHFQAAVFIFKVSMRNSSKGGGISVSVITTYYVTYHVWARVLFPSDACFHGSFKVNNHFFSTDLPRIDFRSISVPGTSSSRQRQPPGAQQSHSAPGELALSPQGLDNPALLRDMLLANPHELSLLKERNPPLADALLSGDLGKLIRKTVKLTWGEVVYHSRWGELEATRVFSPLWHMSWWTYQLI